MPSLPGTVTETGANPVPCRHCTQDTVCLISISGSNNWPIAIGATRYFIPLQAAPGEVMGTWFGGNKVIKVLCWFVTCNFCRSCLCGLSSRNSSYLAWSCWVINHPWRVTRAGFSVCRHGLLWVNPQHCWTFSLSPTSSFSHDLRKKKIPHFTGLFFFF